MVADEIWLTNVIQGIKAVTNFSGRLYQHDLASKMITQLNKYA